jgi:formate dehydrogenase iron-sulfur subunit
MCATKALLAGDGNTVSDIYRERVTWRGSAGMSWGWGVAYGKSGLRKSTAIEGKATGGE